MARRRRFRFGWVKRRDVRGNYRRKWRRFGSARWRTLSLPRIFDERMRLGRSAAQSKWPHMFERVRPNWARLPSQRTVVAERFFDQAGGMQFVLHAPFGSRITRAWGLALRKRFCRTFNFELQAAATDNGLVLSLSDQHSFPLSLVFAFLKAATVEDVLRQAVLTAPMFGARWRWNATRALAVLRFGGGRRIPAPLQRMKSDDLLAAVFPDQVACAENLDRADSGSGSSAGERDDR